MSETSRSAATLLGGDLVDASGADVGLRRERQRRRRLWLLAVLLTPPFAFLWMTANWSRRKSGLEASWASALRRC